MAAAEQTCPGFTFLPPAVPKSPAELAELREHEPVARVGLPNGEAAWLVTRYADVRHVLADGRLSRAAGTATGAAGAGPVRPQSRSMTAMDPPDHTRLRRLVMPAFAAVRLELLRPRIQQATDALLAGLAHSDPPVDLLAQLCRPLALIVLCEVLGVPDLDREAFIDWSYQGLGAGDADAQELLEGYLAELVDAKLSRPGADVLSALGAVRDGRDRLGQCELFALSCTLLTAGYRPVSNALGAGALTLLRHPDQLDRLRENPDLVPSAVEELLRYTGPGGGSTIRIATEDLELGGRTISAGEAVIASTTSANRDRTVFADPDRLDLGRKDNPHLAFGSGSHHCLGAPLARMVLTIAFGTLLRGFPRLRLAMPVAGPTGAEGTASSGLEALPVRW